MKFKRIVLTITIICFSLSTTGCGQALYVMSEEEETLITLYAAKMVSKFNKNQPNGIANARVREGELDEAYGLVPEEEEIFEEEETVQEDTTVDLSNVDDYETSVESNEPQATSSEYSLSEAINFPGMDFLITSFDITDEFVASSSFVLTEVKGKKYLVLNIVGENHTESDINFKDFGSGNYLMTINGGTSSKSQYSFLDNDLSIFSGNVAAGESKEFILVFQFDNKATSDIKAINLEVTRNGDSRGTTFSIQ